jgi:hypothetical protein
MRAATRHPLSRIDEDIVKYLADLARIDLPGPFTPSIAPSSITFGYRR